MKKAYIHTDIEGVAGYVHYYSFSGSLFNYHHVQRMNRLLTREVQAAALAFKEAGVDEVIVNDSHGAAYNLLFEELDPICKIIHGRPGAGPSWTPLLERDVDVAVAIGMHAKAGTPNAVCNHSLWHLTDGEGRKHEWSELGMFAHLCSLHGVPLVAVSGDQYICAEAEALIPGCVGIVVKESLALQNACSLHPDAACEAIRQGVLMGVSRRECVKMPVVKGPFRLNLSDRDPAVLCQEVDELGENLEEVMIGFCNRQFAHYRRDDAIDDRSWRYPATMFTA